MYCLAGLSIGGQPQIFGVASYQERMQGEREQQLRAAKHDEGLTPADIGNQRARKRNTDGRGQSSDQRHDGKRQPTLAHKPVGNNRKSYGIKRQGRSDAQTAGPEGIKLPESLNLR